MLNQRLKNIEKELYKLKTNKSKVLIRVTPIHINTDHPKDYDGDIL